MKLNRIIFIFIALLTLSLVGCGSSSNPASSGNVNSGLVNVNGRVNNLSGSGRVSFYTPTAAAKNGLNVANTPFRASVSNDGVYTFNTDEKGNYSGTIPAGDYYVIAENSDGSMRSVSAKQTISSARAATSATQNFTLAKTVNISGKLSKDIDVQLDSTTTETGEVVNAYIPVYIEGLPFVAVTNLNGEFTFNSVPVITSNSEIKTYVLKAYVNAEGESLIASMSLDQSHFTSQSDFTLSKDLKFVMSDLGNSKFISGIVLPAGTSTDENTPQSESVTGVKGVIVVALLKSGKVLSAVSDDLGIFVIEVGPDDNTEGVTLTTDMITYETSVNVSDDPSDQNNTLYVSNGSSSSSEVGGIIITEAYDTVFTQNSENTLTVYGDNPAGSDNIVCLSERVYQKLENYYVNNLENGKSYRYMLVSRNYESGSYGFRFSDYVDAGNPFTSVTSDYLIEFSQPYIAVDDNTYSAKYNIIKGDEDYLRVTAYALGEHADEPIELSINSDKSIALEDIEEGVYSIYTIHKVSYNGMEATVISDSVPYVKR